MPKLLTLTLLLALPSLAFAHEGREDQYGCHRDPTNGDYHCHNGANAGKHFTSQQEMLKKPGKPGLPWKKGKTPAHAPENNATKPGPVGPGGVKSPDKSADAKPEQKKKLKWKE
jgi:hypothetical protein